MHPLTQQQSFCEVSDQSIKKQLGNLLRAYKFEGCGDFSHFLQLTILFHELQPALE